MARNQPEFQLQCVVADLLRFQGKHDQGLYWTHIPNGEARSARTGARLKRMGVRAGAPDIFIIWQGVPYGLELKADQKGRQTPEQISTAFDWERAGGRYFICRGYEEAVSALTDIDCIRPVHGVKRFEPRKVEAA